MTNLEDDFQLEITVEELELLVKLFRRAQFRSSITEFLTTVRRDAIGDPSNALVCVTPKIIGLLTDSNGCCLCRSSEQEELH